MPKKTPTSSRSNRQQLPKPEPSDYDMDNRDLIERVLHSPVLNGGFNTLMVKVEGIQETQEKIGTKVDSIHEAIYHPDEGLFARVKSVEVTKAEGVDKLEKDVLELKLWRGNSEKTTEHGAGIVDEHTKLVRTHDEQLRDLVRFRDRVMGVAKWLAVTLAAGGLTLVGKLIYDVLSKHLQYV